MFEQIYISPMVTAISVAGALSSGGQAGCNADFLSRFLISHHDFSTGRYEGWIEKKTPLHERTGIIIYDYF